MKNFRLPQISVKDVPAYIRGGFRSVGRDYGQLKGTNILTFIMYGLLFDMVNSLWRPFAALFLERLGGTYFQFSLLSSLPGLVGAIVLLPGAMLFRKFTDKKRATATFILISRFMLLALAAVPLLPASLRPLLFVVFVATMNCPDALSQTSLQSLLGAVFNGSTRAQAIALRTKFGQAVIPVVTISSGLAITFIPNTDEQRMFLYQLFFAGAFLLGLVEVFVFSRLKVEKAESESGAKKTGVDAGVQASSRGAAKDFPKSAAISKTGSESPIKQLISISKDRRFRKFFIPALCFAFTWQAGWPLFSIFQVRVIQSTELWFAVYALMSGFASFVSGGFWQRILRKRGNNTTFVVSAGVLALNAIMVPFVPNVQIMAIVSFIGGFSAIGINTSMLNGVLEATPDENRMMYLAYYNTAINISLFVAPIFAAFLLMATNITVALVSVGFLRMCGMGFIWLSHRLDSKNSCVDV